MNRPWHTILLTLVLLLFCGTVLVSKVSNAANVDSRYFTIDINRQTDVARLLKVLNVDYFLQFENIFTKSSNNPNDILAKSMDAVFLEIANILSIQLYDVKISMKIFANQSQLSDEFQRIFGTGFTEPAFYSHELNTIFISADNATLGVIGHEITHAVISHYFVVPPPPKIQEVLSGYVEYSLRKSTHSLPSSANTDPGY